MTQSSLFGIDADFRAFHAEHPEVYAELVRRAVIAKANGFKRYGIKALIEVVRWYFHFERPKNAPFKINNNFTSRYARLIMEREVDLVGFFETRELRT